MTEPIVNALGNRNRMVDDLIILKNSGDTAKKTSAAATASASAMVFDTGGGFTEGMLVLDVSSVATTSTAGTVSDWSILLQGGATAAFATPIVTLASLQLGDAGMVDHTREYTTGRWIIPFNNDFGGNIFRYLRLYHLAGATPGTVGIDYSGFLSV